MITNKINNDKKYFADYFCGALSIILFFVILKGVAVIENHIDTNNKAINNVISNTIYDNRIRKEYKKVGILFVQQDENFKSNIFSFYTKEGIFKSFLNEEPDVSDLKHMFIAYPYSKGYLKSKGFNLVAICSSVKNKCYKGIFQSIQ